MPDQPRMAFLLENDIYKKKIIYYKTITMEKVKLT